MTKSATNQYARTKAARLAILLEARNVPSQ